MLEYAILGTGPLEGSEAKGNHCEAVVAYTGGEPGVGKPVGLCKRAVLVNSRGPEGFR